MKDAIITAIGTMAPGEYNKVEVDGTGKCTGPFYAHSMEINGAMKAQGAVRCDEGEINGAFSCVDRLDAGELEVDGTAKVQGSAGVEKLEVDGIFTVEENLETTSVRCGGVINAGGKVTADTMEVDGTLKCTDISASRVEMDGVIKVEGQVSADKVLVDGIINAGEVVGDEVVIESSDNHPASQVGLVEATTITLQGVKADTVNGTYVTIGPACIIGALDCNGTLRIHPSARVATVTGDYTLEGED